MSNEVTKFMWYMCNRWNLDEARFLFGDNLGAHIYQKKLHLQEKKRHINFIRQRKKNISKN